MRRMEIQIISGFLGAGKTTFLNRYLPLLSGKTAVIINDDGNIKLNEALLSDNLSSQKLTSGCICCTLVLDFKNTIHQISEEIKPDRIIIEASGIGKLSDVEKACLSLKKEGIDLGVTKKITMIDMPEHEMYAGGMGDFYLDQVRSAQMILPGHLEDLSSEEKEKLFEMLKAENPDAVLYMEDYRQLSDGDLINLIGK